MRSGSRLQTPGALGRAKAATGREISLGVSVLTIDQVGRNFGGVRALDDVSLGVEAGEILAIIGPNGAGKTTLINAISGRYPADRGRILLEDRDITGLPPYKIAQLGIARTFQNVALFKGMTVLDNLMLGRHVHMKSRTWRCGLYWGLAQKEEIAHRKVVEDIIDFLEIEPIRKRLVAELPLGLQKRVELGRALALQPKILLLDEPMAGMNLEEKEDMARFILDVNEDLATTVLLIEHDMGVVMDISDRIVVLDLGRKITEGTPLAVRTNAEVIKAYLGEETAGGWAPKG
jgi:branched-chain amino acid transport system ATP-binding protein